MSRVWTLITVVIGSALLSTCYSFSIICVDHNYSGWAEFKQAPPNDDALKTWLESQSSVKKVNIRRDNENGLFRIGIALSMRGNVYGSDPPPDLDSQLEDLGYGGRQKPLGPLQKHSATPAFE